MRILTPVVVSLLGFAAVTCVQASEVTKAGVTVLAPWALATPGGVSNGIAFLQIREAEGIDDRLVSIASPAAGRAELHTHTMDGNVMRMRRVDAIALDPKAPTVLKPHGAHIMLMDLKAPLKVGDAIALTLTFEKAGDITVEAAVQPIGTTALSAVGGLPDAAANSVTHDHHH